MNGVAAMIGLMVSFSYGYWRANKDTEKTLHEMTEKGEINAITFELITKKQFRPRKIYPKLERLRARSQILHDKVHHALYSVLIAMVILIMIGAVILAIWMGRQNAMGGT